MTMTELAKRETELFKERQDTYGKMCADSALKAFLTMAEDGHSGFSWSVTAGLLTRLLNDLPLTPIEDSDFLDQEGVMQEGREYLREHNLKSSLACKRMCGIFREETLDGKVTYTDVNRVACYEEEHPNIGFHSGMATALVDRLFPIEMPYYPPVAKYVVMFREDKPIWIKKPDGERVEIKPGDLEGI